MPRSSHPLRSDRIAILGAGPCGLACANELQRLGHRAWVLLEAAPAPGGLASSVVDAAGFTWDLGGHVVFSHFGEFDRLLAELFTADELLHHDRSSYVRFRDRWVPYPFQHHLRHLPAEDAAACVHDLLLACQRREELPAGADFATWLQAMYGSGLVERFFSPYNSKIWATAPEQMASSWVAERIAPVSAEEILAAFCGTARPARRWGPNATFAFPARGGTGEIWRRLAARLDGGLRTAARAVAVDPASHTVTLADGERIGFDHLVATGPLDQLAAMTSGAPQAVRAAAGQLRHTSVAMVGLGYQAPTTDERSWLYFPQQDVPFYRATNFSKYAPANVPDANPQAFSAWMTETSMLPGTHLNTYGLVHDCDQAVRRHGLVPEHAPLASAHLEVIEYAYPVPTLGRDAALAEVVPWMEARGIYPRGRFGTWRYEIGNMDHAVKMGIDIARRLVNGAAEELLAPAPGVAAVAGGQA
ncbi:protoporphyrinogen/coproporphyrinogen oxidase [Streptomyces zagrosensis]|uniref:UDP-galactopyranose mutase n=1 Tax=Streptomyces zagrosensis TaxID=1042984 RepID=A0A7W9QHU9_9ACTN|nr:FAD-dependent oxidoreductase [Streptomyces zagrosensis]MBB5939522.1 UDP-galactopyranose mutase [Streptomyces zagrosensis]